MRKPVGPVWRESGTRVTVVPDTRAPGAWLVKVTSADGKRTQSQYTSAAEATAEAQSFLAGLRDPASLAPRPGVLTMSDLIDRYEQARRILNTERRRNTFRAQGHAFGIIRATWGARAPGAFTKDDVTAWLGTLLQPTGRHPPTTRGSAPCT